MEGAGREMKSLSRPLDKSELLHRLRAVRRDSAPRWGRMTAHQMVCHLADSFRMASGEKPVRSDTNLLKGTMLKWAVLYLPLPWPPGIPTSWELDQEREGTPPDDFEADVARLEALMDAVTAPTRAPAPPRHPIFGAMSHAAWLRWGYLHMAHHLRQFGA